MPSTHSEGGRKFPCSTTESKLDIIIVIVITHQLRIGEIWNRMDGEDDDEASNGQGSHGRDYPSWIGRQDPAVTDSQNMVRQDN